MGVTAWPSLELSDGRHRCLDRAEEVGGFVYLREQVDAWPAKCLRSEQVGVGIFDPGDQTGSRIGIWLEDVLYLVAVKVLSLLTDSLSIRLERAEPSHGQWRLSGLSGQISCSASEVCLSIGAERYLAPRRLWLRALQIARHQVEL